jgi:hypothetical protein
MRLHIAAVAAICCIFGNASAQSSQGPQGTVSGHLYCADSQTPCRFASVIIQSAPPIRDGKPVESDAPSHSYSSATDIEGAYQISGVAPGEYYALGKLQGYLSAYDLAVSMYSGDSSLSAQALEIALTRITVEAGRLTVSNLTLSRGASLGGTLHYDDGALAINLPVHLFRKDANGIWKPYTNTAGGYVLAPLGLEQHTDDRGQFHEPGLPPGTYTLEATLPQSTFSPSTITGTPSLNVSVATGNALRVYDGEKFRLREAIAIELHEGEQRSDIDIRLPTHGLHSIRGAVTAGTDQHTVTSGTVSLLDPGDKAPLRQAEIQNDGSFSFNYVVNGTYLVSIEPAPIRTGGKNAVPFASLTEQVIVETDISDLRYNLLQRKQ